MNQNSLHDPKVFWGIKQEMKQKGWGCSDKKNGLSCFCPMPVFLKGWRRNWFNIGDKK